MNGNWLEILWPEVAIWVALVALLILTLVAAFMPLGGLGAVANLGIAAAKALLVGWFFMHLRQASGLNRLASILGLIFLALLLSLTLADLITRRPEIGG